ncbi:metallophosphoesterase family protein [Actinoplanes palleronii]|uniref:Calcineurin-like phosphoesterase domain-containing protein n=1 Tax=Actinoplanes palleronii TaxID=113570 RepID=A0ABQ4B6B1_9ACTN|nr:metallophosphoesterase [Actinoplanes palleronii]GIE66208.1 hypothetical protein Apa02nite_023160 [Actinoplanes palleronii]
MTTESWLRLLGTETEPVTSLGYRSARRGGGSEHLRLPVDRLRVDRVPDGCDAVLVVSDLQGVAVSPLSGATVLLGQAFAEQLEIWAQSELLPAPDRLGVLLAGDLFSAPGADQRGASGPVAEVWRAFATAGCPFVAGVAGNHDEVDAAEVAGYGPAVTLLDGDRTGWGACTVAGVSGVSGDPQRPMRRPEPDFLGLVRAVTATPPAVLLLHEGPTGTDQAQRGNPLIRELLESRPPGLTVCGHVHWDQPVARLGDGHVLNVDARAILLEPAG